MAENKFGETMESLFKGMDTFISSKTVVGDAVKFDDGTIVLPLVDVSFGVAAGAFANDGDKKNNGGGGMGGKIQPSAVLVIKDGSSKLVNVKNQSGMTKILDMVPDFVDKFAGGGDDDEADKKSKKKKKKDKKADEPVVEELSDGDVVVHDA
ncbi:MAG: GerW family sporulation protein [Eubacterium sp.]|nr:GerW family sporulation protein [Eubacterium sp.]